MSTTLRDWDRIARVVYTDPKFVAQLEWFREYDVAAQLARQWPREEMAHYASSGQHLFPDRMGKLVFHEMPDFDWWEPRYDQRGRREQARHREHGIV